MAKTKRMFMGGAAKAAMQSVKSAPKTGPAKPGMPPPAGPSQMQFMSDKLRGKPSMPPPAGPGKMQGLGQAMSGNPQMAQNLGKVAGAAMGGMGMKKGGTASSRADGCAIQGKTKGRFA
jgi:hypothetical protein